MRIFFLGVLFLISTVDSYGQCTPVIGSNPDPATVCEDLTIQFSDNSSCSSLDRNWDFGDGSPETDVQNPSHTFSAGNLGDTTYTVVLEKQDLNGDWHSTSKNVTVYKKPDASFEVSSLTACIIVDTLQFTNTSSMPAGNMVSWDFGDGSPLSATENPTHTFNSTASSSYSVKLTVTNQRGCSRTATKEITVNEIPNPNFNMNSNVGCDPLEVTFTNTTAEGAFPVTDWEWDFGGQGSATTKEPGSFTFNGAEIYAVSLSATNTAGCTNTTTNTVVVKKAPTITFDLPAEVCVNDTAVVQYTGDGDPNATYIWDFKNSASVTGSGQGPWKVTYAASGTKEITLEVTENGCNTEGATTITVNALPEVALVSNDQDNGICVGEEVVFSAVPSEFEHYTFFNNGTEVQSSTHDKYSTTSLDPGNNIWVTVSDEKGCGSDASNAISIVVNQKPDISISALSTVVCEGDTVVVTATGAFQQYTFESGFVALQTGPSNVLLTTQLDDGDEVTAYATDLGCKGNTSNAILIGEEQPVNPPVVNCAASTNSTITVVWNDDPLVSSYHLSVNNGAFYNPLTRATETVTGLSANDTVWFKIFGETALACGNTEITDSVYCIAKPCFAISLDADKETRVCEGDTVNLSFDNLITPSSEYGISWGDGDFGKSQEETLIPVSDTNVVVSIIDSSQFGCPPYQYSFFVGVNPKPSCEILSDGLNLCEGLTYAFTGSQPGYDRYEYFIDGIAVQDSTYHIYEAGGLTPTTHEIVLRTTDKGCFSGDSINIVVVPTEHSEISTAVSEVCSGDLIDYAAAENFDYYYFLDAITGDTLQDSTTHTLSVKDVYEVILTARDQYGCLSFPDTIQIGEKPLPSVTLSSSAGSPEVCERDTLTFTASSSSATSYAFYRDYHVLQNGTSPIYDASSVADGSAYYVVATANGCEGPPSDTLIYSVFDTLFPPQINCGTTGAGTVEVIWDSIPGATGYRISIDGATYGFPSTGSDGLMHLVSGLNEIDSIFATLIATGDAPCGNSIPSDTIQCFLACENPFTIQQNFIEGNFCEGDEILLSIERITGGSGNFTIEWDGVQGEDEIQVTASSDTVITVSVRDNDQPSCPPVIKKFRLTVNPYPEVTLSGDAVYCSNQAAQFTAAPTSYENYQFFNRLTSLSNGTNPSISDSALVDGHYYYVVATEKGCSDTSNVIEITVAPEVRAPNLFCGNTTTSSIDFEWLAVTGATGYEISINGFPYEIPTSGGNGLIHRITGLNPGEIVSARVRALGPNPCGNSEASRTVTCYALECGKMAFEINRDTTLCEGDEFAIQISNIESPSAQYGLSWDGINYGKITTETLVARSDTTIEITMLDSTQLNCPSTQIAVDFKVNPLPLVDLNSSLIGSEICERDTLTLKATSLLATDYTFYRDYHVLQYGASNSYTSRIIKEGRSYFVVGSARGCTGPASDTFTFTVSDTLFPPQVSCGTAGEGSLEIVWDEIPDATAYHISVNGAAYEFPSTGALGLMHLVEGLDENDSLTATVIAAGDDPCGNSMASDTVKCYVNCEAFSYEQNLVEEAFCVGDEVALSISEIEGGTGGFRIQWNGTLGGFENNFTAVKDTLITVSVTDTNQLSCKAVKKQFWVRVNEFPEVTLVGEDTYCSNEIAIFNANPTSYDNYEFFDRLLSVSNGLAPYMIDSIPEDGHYYSVVATNDGCSDTSNVITISVAQEIGVPNLFCGNTSTATIDFEWTAVSGAVGYEISVDGGPYQTPSSGAMGQIHQITGLTPGAIKWAQVRALGPAPCDISAPSDTATCISQDCERVAFEIPQDTVLCEGASLIIQLTQLESPSLQYGLQWDGISYEKSTTKEFSFFADTTITVAMIDSTQLNCPPTELSMNIAVTPAPEFSIYLDNPSDSVCHGATFVLRSSVQGYDQYIYSVNDLPVQDSIASTYSTEALPMGPHVVSASAIHRGCAFDANEVQLEVLRFPELTFTSSDANDTICAGDTLVFIANTGFDYYEFFRSDTLAQDGLDNTISIGNLDDREGVYVVASTYNLCFRTSEVNRTKVIEIPNFNLVSSEEDHTICDQDTVTFTIVPTPDFYELYNQGQRIGSFLTAPSFSIDTLEGSDQLYIWGNIGGCVDYSDTIRTRVEYRPTVEITAMVDSICVGASATATAIGGDSYLWSNGDTAATTEIDLTTTGNIWVQAVAGNCYSYPVRENIFVDEQIPVAAVGPDEEICRYQSIPLSVSGGKRYLWVSGDSISDSTSESPFVTPLQTDTFKVLVFNEVCMDSAEVIVYVDRCLTELPEELPQIITPNADGKNDALIFIDIDYFQDAKLMVYNRWSNLIFEATQYNNDWYGTTSDGSELPAGTYYYVLDLGNGREPYTNYLMIQR